MKLLTSRNLRVVYAPELLIRIYISINLFYETRFSTHSPTTAGNMFLRVCNLSNLQAGTPHGFVFNISVDIMCMMYPAALVRSKHHTHTIMPDKRSLKGPGVTQIRELPRPANALEV
jgi:hypothetical protein